MHIGNIISTGTITARDILTDYVRENGPIATARVSSAQARGAAKKYCYWGCVRYQIRLTASGALSNVALERASSDRRSERLAESDCDDLCEREDRIQLQRIGSLTESDAESILACVVREVANA